MLALQAGLILSESEIAKLPGWAQRIIQRSQVAPAIDLSKDYAGIEAEDPNLETILRAKVTYALAKKELVRLTKKVRAVGLEDIDSKQLYKDLVGNPVIY